MATGELAKQFRVGIGAMFRRLRVENHAPRRESSRSWFGGGQHGTQADSKCLWRALGHHATARGLESGDLALTSEHAGRAGRQSLHGRQRRLFVRGRRDGKDVGVDIRLYQSQAVPQLVTLVQAKRYARRPVGLEAVAALFGIAVKEGADRGLLVTTSRFQPAARSFAASVSGTLELPNIDLAHSTHVGRWCADIAKELDAYFNNGTLSTPAIMEPGIATELVGRIVVAHSYTSVRNSFAKIAADFRHEVVLQPIDAQDVSGDGQRGSEVAVDSGTPHRRFVAFKRGASHSGDPTFWGNRKLYCLWDGTPQHFDTAD